MNPRPPITPVDRAVRDAVSRMRAPTQEQADPAAVRHREVIERLDRLIELQELKVLLLKGISNKPAGGYRP